MKVNSPRTGDAVELRQVIGLRIFLGLSAHWLTPRNCFIVSHGTAKLHLSLVLRVQVF